MKTIAFQTEFRPELPVVFGAKDDHEVRTTIEEMDRILTTTGIEQRMLVQHFNSPTHSNSEEYSQRQYKSLRLALRYAILLAMTDLSYRELLHRAADSEIFQWFTHTSAINGVRPASKSSFERFEKYFSSDEIFADTTCVRSNIHFPVDWVLLRDATHTLIKSIELIRSQELKHRIGDSRKFLRDMNKLCIEMTHVRKKKGAKKMRKKIFRRMKILMKTVENHAHNYHYLLECCFEKNVFGIGSIYTKRKCTIELVFGISRH